MGGSPRDPGVRSRAEPPSLGSRPLGTQRSILKVPKMPERSCTLSVRGAGTQFQSAFCPWPPPVGRWPVPRPRARLAPLCCAKEEAVFKKLPCPPTKAHTSFSPPSSTTLSSGRCVPEPGGWREEGRTVVIAHPGAASVPEPAGSGDTNTCPRAREATNTARQHPTARTPRPDRTTLLEVPTVKQER